MTLSAYGDIGRDMLSGVADRVPLYKRRFPKMSKKALQNHLHEYEEAKGCMTYHSKAHDMPFQNIPLELFAILFPAEL